MILTNCVMDVAKLIVVNEIMLAIQCKKKI